MPELCEKLAERLREDGRRTLEFLQNIPPESWNVTIYTEGNSWTLHQIIAHFVSAELGNSRLVKSIVRGGPGSPIDFNIDSFNQKEVELLESEPDQFLLDLFSASREKTVDMVRAFTASDLAKNGRHPFLGEAAVEDIIKLIYRHNQIHIRDIKRVLGSTADQPM